MFLDVKRDYIPKIDVELFKRLGWYNDFKPDRRFRNVAYKFCRKMYHDMPFIYSERS